MCRWRASNLDAELQDGASIWRARFARFPGVSDVFIPQDIDYPALQLDIDRTRAGELGLTQKEVVDNVITALTSNSMIAPSYWIDPKTGNDYMLTVQYPETQIKTCRRSEGDSAARGRGSAMPTRLDAVSQITRIESPTEVDHYQIRRVIDIYVQPQGRGPGQNRQPRSTRSSPSTNMPEGLVVTMRGMVQGDATRHSTASAWA